MDELPTPARNLTLSYFDVGVGGYKLSLLPASSVITKSMLEYPVNLAQTVETSLSNIIGEKFLSLHIGTCTT